MGRVVVHEVVGFRCEFAATIVGRAPSCDAQVPVNPAPREAGWAGHLGELRDLVRIGWAFVLNKTMRAYCPEHAPRAWDCKCRWLPDRAHLCTSHGDARHLVWDSATVPEIVNEELRKIGVAA